MPTTAARRRLLRRLIEAGAVSSQRELTAALEEAGHPVSQATVSRDLDAIGARKEPAAGGGGVYRIVGPPTVPADMAAVLNAFVLDVDVSGLLVVVKTPPAAAHLVASAIDGAEIDGVVGTIAGDDTVLVVAAESAGGSKVAERLRGDAR